MYIYIGLNLHPVEDKGQLCQLSSKRLEDNWRSGHLSLTLPYHLPFHIPLSFPGGAKG